eukprot:Nk52_evm118s151 gene=Nk52_evmTU118s151
MSATSLKEVKDWLGNLNLGQYYATFQKEGFDSMLAVQEITAEDLECMKLKRGHAKIVLRQVENLRAANAQHLMSSLPPWSQPTSRRSSILPPLSAYQGYTIQEPVQQAQPNGSSFPTGRSGSIFNSRLADHKPPTEQGSSTSPAAPSAQPKRSSLKRPSSSAAAASSRNSTANSRKKTKTVSTTESRRGSYSGKKIHVDIDELMKVTFGSSSPASGQSPIKKQSTAKSPTSSGSGAKKKVAIAKRSIPQGLSPNERRRIRREEERRAMAADLLAKKKAGEPIDMAKWKKCKIHIDEECMCLKEFKEGLKGKSASPGRTSSKLSSDPLIRATQTKLEQERKMFEKKTKGGSPKSPVKTRARKAGQSIGKRFPRAPPKQSPAKKSPTKKPSPQKSTSDKDDSKKSTTRKVVFPRKVVPRDTPPRTLVSKKESPKKTPAKKASSASAPTSSKSKSKESKTPRSSSRFPVRSSRRR